MMSWISLMVFLHTLTVPAVYCFPSETCPRKEPPPGVLVLHPGSTLVLGCSGLVAVNGRRVKVNGSEHPSRSTGVHITTAIASNGATASAVTDGNVIGKYTSANRVDTAFFNETDTPVVSGTDHSKTNRFDGTVTRSQEVRHLTTLPARHSDSQSRPSPIGTMILPTTDSRVEGAVTELHSDWWDEKMDRDYEEEVAEGRTVRGQRERSQWRLNGKLLRGRNEMEGGKRVLSKRGAILTVPSVDFTDSGNYSCQRGGKLVSSLSVSVSVPPERPTLSCYKRSPSSKIRCDWTASQPVTPAPQCYLLVRKTLFGSFSRVNCSYSTKMSRCWCVLEHQVENNRDSHLVYLCVTNTAGNTTSHPLDFQPLDISKLKPDPPSNIQVRVVEGQERRLWVSWSIPRSWKERDLYHELRYELRYHTVPQGIQINGSTTMRMYCITDALPGERYLIQLRAKEEFDGYWSEWSEPVYASTWKAPGPTPPNDLSTIMDIEGTESGSGMTEELEVTELDGGVEVWPHVLWVIGSCVLLSITLLSIYLYRHRVRFMSKLQRLSPVSSSSAGHSLPATVLPYQEGHALVNFNTPCYKERLPQDEQKKVENEGEEGEEGEEREEEEEIEEVVHFNNTSYFLVQNN
ncbi:interleukin-6 receptor subunit alpha isoform X2 [Esox lucius]|uniref:interleukin-6 receptor subunit alpha isoform X2 n=1 Tax=Esox lucius TaxID=8010 RepID=UPI001477006B|nr:interleukin-6 receptor subunit alpha isoform X2 [Esox lucius]